MPSSATRRTISSPCRCTPTSTREAAAWRDALASSSRASDSSSSSRAPAAAGHAEELVADGQQLLQRAVVQRLGDAAARAVLGVDRLRDEPAAGGGDLGDLGLGGAPLDG